MSKDSARRPGANPEDAWERLFKAPIDQAVPEVVDEDEDDGPDVPDVQLEPMVDNEQENDK